MKKLMLIGVAVGALSAFGYDPETITPVDWSTQSGTYIVPAGQTNLVTETDIGYVNALDSLKFGDAASAVVFISTTAPAVLFDGLGTVVKEGAAAWELTKAQTKSTWKGNWDIREGEVWLCVKDQPAEAAKKQQTMFYISSSAPHTLYIREGAKLVYNSAVSFQYVDIRLAGTLQVTGETTDGKTIYRVYSTSASFTHFTIESDTAKIIQDTGNYMWFSRASDDEEVSLDLNGHKLTCLLDASIYIFRGWVKGPGTLRLEQQTPSTTEWTLTVRNSLKSGFVDPSVTVELADKTGIRMDEHPTLPQVAKMVVEGTSTFQHQHSGNNKTTIVCPEDGVDSGLFWDGPIELKNADSVLSVYNAPLSGYYENCHATMGLRGPISGPGSLILGSSGSQCRIYLSCPTNTYTGTTTFKDRTDNVYLVAGSNSVPNAAGVTSTSDRFYLTFDPARDDDWTLARIVDLYREGTYTYYKYGPRLLTKSGEVILFDGTGLSALGAGDLFEPMIAGGGEVKIAAPFGDAVLLPHFADPDASPTLTLTGAGTVAISNKAATAGVDYDGLLHITGNTRADLFGLPYAASTMRGVTPRMKFSNGGSTVLRGVRVDEYYKDSVTNMLAVGYVNGTGRVEIAEGALLTNRVIVGSYSSTADRPRGVIRQTGGELALIGQYKDSQQNSMSQVGRWGQGGYALEGGTLALLGSFLVGNYGNGVLRQTGGLIKMVTYPWGTDATETPVFSAGINGGTADLIFAGGRADFGEGEMYLARGTLGSSTTVTVEGDAFVTAKKWWNIKATGHLTVNLRGGTLAGRWSVYSEFRDTWINFDGGTYRMTESLGNGYFGDIYQWAKEGKSYPVTLKVGPNGGALDAANFYQHVWVPFTAQQGGAVKSIPWTDTETVYPVPPTVVISGDGQHATAYADYDYETGRIKGIVVTCGGENYTAATAQLEYQHSDERYPSAHEDLLAEPIDCVIDASPVSGGMTFKASGIASGTSNYIGLHCTNTYAGATTVDMQYDSETGAPGILYCYADDQFPNSHKLVVKSGHLAFNSHAQDSFTELEMSGGKMSGYPSGQQMTLEQVTFAGTPNLGNVPMTVGKIAVDAANPPTLTLAKITAADGAKITVKNAAALADIARGVTLFTCDITDGAKITVENPDDLPANVKLVWSNGRLRASRTDIGSVLLIR